MHPDAAVRMNRMITFSDSIIDQLSITNRTGVWWILVMVEHKKCTWHYILSVLFNRRHPITNAQPTIMLSHQKCVLLN